MKLVIDPAQLAAGDLSGCADASRPVAWHPDWPQRFNSRRAALVLDQPLGDLGRVLPVEFAAIRALPAFFTARLHMLMADLDADALDRMLPEIKAALTANPRFVRMETYIMAASDADRRAYEAVLARHQFIEAKDGCFPVTYRDSSLIDLAPAIAEIEARVSRRAWRQIALVQKRPVRLVRIDDAAYGPRLAALWHETVARKGARVVQIPWAEYIDFSNKHPGRSAIFGLAAEGAEGPDSLLSFIWATRSGPFAHYEEGATASAGDARIGLAHAPMWACIEWAKSVGARWFDLTGVTGPNSNHGASMEGVTEFKRQFGGGELQVRSDWGWTARPIIVHTAAAAAQAVRRPQAMLRALKTRLAS